MARRRSSPIDGKQKKNAPPPVSKDGARNGAIEMDEMGQATDILSTRAVLKSSTHAQERTETHDMEQE